MAEEGWIQDDLLLPINGTLHHERRCRCELYQKRRIAIVNDAYGFRSSAQTLYKDNMVAPEAVLPNTLMKR